MLNYDYAASQQYCESLGLMWIPAWLDEADIDAVRAEITQEQMDVIMRHHLWQVHHLFTPQTYSWGVRIGMAVHFLFGKAPSKRIKK